MQLREMLKDIHNGGFAIKKTSSSQTLKKGHFTDEYETSLDQLEKENRLNDIKNLNEEFIYTMKT